MLDAITSIIPSSKVGTRLSAFGSTYGAEDSTPEETYSYVINKLNDYDLTFLHIIEPRGFHNKTDKVPESGVTPFVRAIYKGVLITSSGFDRQKALDVVDEGKADAVAFGRDFISNPDLVKRLQLDLPLNKVDDKTFYVANRDISKAAIGYTDYPTFDVEATA